jgi:predicted MFS family arabinose efflux permease
VLQVAGPLQAFSPAAIALAVAAIVIATTPVQHVDEDHHDRPAPMRGLIDATRWLLRSRPALSVAILGAMSGGSLFSYSALLPAFTRDQLQAEAATLGLLTGAGGLGAIAGALIMDTSGRRLGRGRQTVVMLIGAALGLVALGLTTVLPAAVVLAAVIVLLAVLFGGTAQLIVQTAPPPRIRAGVVAVYTFAYYVVVPMGTTTVGVLADAYGVQAVLFGMAGVTIVGTAVVLAWFPGLLRVDVDEHGDLVDPSAHRARPQPGAIVGP